MIFQFFDNFSLIDAFEKAERKADKYIKCIDSVSSQEDTPRRKQQPPSATEIASEPVNSLNTGKLLSTRVVKFAY
jgi:hypothetical protein